MVEFLLKILLKQIILAAYHDFHLLTAKPHSRYVKESEILVRSELDILPPTPQPCAVINS